MTKKWSKVFLNPIRRQRKKLECSIFKTHGVGPSHTPLLDPEGAGGGLQDPFLKKFVKWGHNGVFLSDFIEKLWAIIFAVRFLRLTPLLRP